MWHAQWSEQLQRADAAARAAPYISSLSVIVPVFNMQDTIGSALASIEASVASLGGMLARSEVHRAHGVPVTCEVIVLDDASTDATQQEVAEFISPALMPDLPASVRLEYTLLVATANSGQAAGRNAAARRAKGEILFFLDADDVFRPEHLGLGYKSLSTNATVAWARTGLVVPDSVLPEWKEAMENGAPTNLVIRRSVFELSEGFSPESMFRRDHEDIMNRHGLDYVQHSLPAYGGGEGGRFGHAKILKDSVEYARRDGNHLDRQITSGKFTHKKTEEHLFDEHHRKGPERGLQIAAAIKAQEEYLKRKIDALIRYEREHAVRVM